MSYNLNLLQVGASELFSKSIFPGIGMRMVATRIIIVEVTSEICLVKQRKALVRIHT